MNMLGDIDPVTVITWVIIIGVVGGILGVAFVQISRSKKNLTALAGRLGFAVTPDLQIPLIPRSCNSRIFSLKVDQPMDIGIAGQMRGRTVRFAKYTTGSGKYAQTWAEMAVSARTGLFTFSLRPDNIAWKLMELFGDHEIKVGDAEFDRRWRVKSNMPEIFGALLLPELRAQIDQSAAKLGEFFLEYDWIRYRERGDYYNDKRVARLESMVGLMCDLAEAAEVAAENKIN